MNEMLYKFTLLTYLLLTVAWPTQLWLSCNTQNGAFHMSPRKWGGGDWLKTGEWWCARPQPKTAKEGNEIFFSEKQRDTDDNRDAVRRIYTVSQKKLGHFNFYCNFGKCWPIFKILSLSESEINGS